MQLLRKLVSVVLVLCFALPLSMCTTKHPDDNNLIVATDTYTYGYELAEQAWNDVKHGNSLEGIGLLLAIFNVFFLPIVCLKLREKFHAILHFFASFPTGYFLYFWVFVFCTRSQYGGILAVFCWVALFCISVIAIGRWLYNSLFKVDVKTSKST
jgi:hypothetical protein